MERIFWVKCPRCGGRFYADYALRHANVQLICPYCEDEFLPNQSPEIDDRWFS